MRVLVTGGAGFIGSHVVDALISADHDVRVADALLPQAHGTVPEYLNPNADYRWLDLASDERLDGLVDDVDVVCHQAAMVGLGKDFSDAPSYVYNNGLATARLLSALASRRFAGRFVLASSMVVYGEGLYECHDHGLVRPEPRFVEDLEAGRFEPGCPACFGELKPAAVTEDAATDPRNVYAATKLHQEHLCSVFGREVGVPVTALRYHNVYGSRMPRSTPYAGVTAVFLSALVEGCSPRVFEDGRQLRDFVHVRDVARANVTAVESDPAPAGAFNIASGSPTSIATMAEILSMSHGPPAAPPVITGDFRRGDVRHVFASPARAESLLGWRAEVTIEEGMKEFAESALRNDQPS